MPRRIITLCFAVLISEKQSDSLSSSLSAEDPSDSDDHTGLIIPQKVRILEKDNLKEIYSDFRNTDYNAHPEIYRDDFNVHVEKIHKPINNINFKTGDFHSSPKYRKNQARLKKIKLLKPPFPENILNVKADSLNELSDGLSTKNRYNRHNKRNSHTREAQSSSKMTRISTDDVKRDTEKSKIKNTKKHSKTHKNTHYTAVSTELELSNEKFLTKIKKSQHSQENAKPNSLKKVADYRKVKYLKADKYRQLRNLTDPQSARDHRKESTVTPLDDKEYIKNPNIETQFDTSLQQTELLLNEKENNVPYTLNKHRQSRELDNSKNKYINGKEFIEMPVNNERHDKHRNNKSKLDSDLHQIESLSKEESNKITGTLDEYSFSNSHKEDKHPNQLLGIPLHNTDSSSQTQLNMHLKQKRLLPNGNQHNKKKESNPNIFSHEPTENIAKPVDDLPKIQENFEGKNEDTIPRKDEFTLTITDMDDSKIEIGNNKPTHQVSSLLDTNPNELQGILEKGPQEPNEVLSKSKIFPGIHVGHFQLKSSKQQPLRMGLIDKNEKIPKNNFKYAGHKSSENNKVTLADMPKIMQMYNKNIDTLIETKNNIHLGEHLIAKKHFDLPLIMNERQNKSKKIFTTTASNTDQMDHDISRREIILNESGDKRMSLEVGKQALRDISSGSKSSDSSSSSSDSTSGYSKKTHHGKRTFKRCRKACNGAYTSVCRRLKCSPKAKRNLRYQCKKSCGRIFKSRKYSSE